MAKAKSREQRKPHQCHGMVGNAVVNPVVAHLGGPPLGGGFPHPQSSSPRLFPGLWSQVQNWPLAGQWLPPGASLLPTQALVPPSGGPLPAHIPSISGMQSVVSLQKLQQLRQQLEVQDNNNSGPLAAELEALIEMKTACGLSEGKKDESLPSLVGSTIHSPCDQKALHQEDSRWSSPERSKIQGALGSKRALSEHANGKRDHKGVGAEFRMRCTSEGPKFLNCSGTLTGGTLTSYEEGHWQSGGQEKHAEPGMCQTIVQPAAVACDGSLKNPANGTGSRGSRVNGNSVQELQNGDVQNGLGKEVGQALFEKLGEEVFWQVRTVLLQQQEVFLSQVWELHRLHWFQTYMQTLLKVPDQSSLKRIVVGSGARTTDMGGEIQASGKRSPEQRAKRISASQGEMKRLSEDGKTRSLKHLGKNNGSPRTNCASKVSPCKERTHPDMYGSTCIPKKARTAKKACQDQNEVLANNVHEAAALLKACRTKAHQQSMSNLRARQMDHKDNPLSPLQISEGRLQNDSRRDGKVMQKSGVSQVLGWGRLDDCQEVSSLRREESPPLWETIPNGSKEVSTKTCKKPVSLFQSANGGDDKLGGIQRHNVTGLQRKGSAGDGKKGQFTFEKGGASKRMKRKIATLPVKVRKKGKHFPPLVEECESIGSGWSGSCDGQEDGSSTDVKERKAADVLLKYLPSAIFSGVKS